MDYLLPMEKENNNFRFVHLDKNYGFAKGYNEGIKAAKGEWICVLNNDTLVTEGWIGRMINHLKEDPDIKVMAPVSNNIHGEHQMVAAPENYSFGEYLSLMEKLGKDQGSKRVYSSWITGCCMVFHRNLLKELANITQTPKVDGILFSECYPYGQGEDTELNFHVQHRLNKKMGVARDVFIWHHGQRTLETVKDINGKPVDWREIQHQNNMILHKRWPEIFPNG